MLADDSTLEVLRAREASWCRPDVGDLKPSLRSLVVRWMRDQASDIGMHPRTAMLAISLLDRFASSRPNVSDDVELLAIACLWVAAKYEEVKVYDSRVLLRLSLRDASRPALTARDLARKEAELLRALDYRLSIPTPFDMMEAMCFDAWKRVPPLRAAALMILRHMIRCPSAHPPSEVAATALVAASTKVPVPMTLVNPELVRAMMSPSHAHAHARTP